MRTSSSLILVLLGGCFSASESKPPPDAAPDIVDSSVDSVLPDSFTPDANPAAPSCVIAMPSSGASTAYDVPVTFTATATDPEDGALTGASIVWRSSLQTAPLGSGETITTTLPPGDNIVTCTATDSTTLTGSATVMVLSKSPFAQINHPATGDAPRPIANAVQFVSGSRDLEDGTLTGAKLVWSSSIDGPLGTGSPRNNMMTAGTHTITLTVTDSMGNIDATTVTLVMQ